MISQTNIYNVASTAAKRIRSDNIDCLAIKTLDADGKSTTVNLFFDNEEAVQDFAKAIQSASDPN